VNIVRKSTHTSRYQASDEGTYTVYIALKFMDRRLRALGAALSIIVGAAGNRTVDMARGPPPEWLDPRAEAPPPLPWTWVRTEEVCAGVGSTRTCNADSPYSRDPRCSETCAPFYQGSWCKAFGAACAYPYWELVAKDPQSRGQRALPPPLNADVVGGELDTCVGQMAANGSLQFVFMTDSIGRQLKFELARWLQCGARAPNWLEVTEEPKHNPGLVYNQTLPWLRDARSPHRCSDFYLHDYRPFTMPPKHPARGAPAKSQPATAPFGAPALSVVNVHVGGFYDQGANPAPGWAGKALGQLVEHLSSDAATLVVQFGPFGLWDKLFSHEANVTAFFEEKLRRFACDVRCELLAERTWPARPDARRGARGAAKKRRVHLVMSSLFAHYAVKPSVQLLDVAPFEAALWRAFRDVFLHRPAPHGYGSGSEGSGSDSRRACGPCGLPVSAHVELLPAWVHGHELHLARRGEMPFSSLDGLHEACLSAYSSPSGGCADMVRDASRRRPDDMAWAAVQLALGKVCGLVAPW